MKGSHDVRLRWLGELLSRHYLPTFVPQLTGLLLSAVEQTPG